MDKEFEDFQENVIREGSDCNLLAKLAYTTLSLSNRSVKGAMVDHVLMPSTSRSPLRCMTPSPEFEPSIIDTKEVG